MKIQKSLIEIRTGSDSDMPKIKATYEFLNQLGIDFSPRILSAHRTPDRMAAEARNLAQNGFRVCIAAAGGSAHLPGMTASESSIPVVGLPVYSATFWGVDALYSIIQMPNGIPVGTVAPGQAESAALIAAQMASLDMPAMRKKIRALMNIENPLTNFDSLKPLIGIVRYPEPKVDGNKYVEMLTLLSDFGISFIELNHDEKLPENIHALERAGATAIISIGAFDQVKERFNFPATGITDLPVIGLPVTNDEVLKYSGNSSITEMLFQKLTVKNKTAPIAIMGVNRYGNAGLYVIQIAGLYNPAISSRFLTYRSQLAQTVIEKDRQLQKSGIEHFL